MTIRPILFSAPMVRALLEGRKVQTRRVISFPGVDKVIDFVCVATDEKGRSVYEMKDANGRHLSRPAGKHFIDYQYSPNFAVGDLLWVREAFRGPHAYEAHGYKLKDWGNKALWFTADGPPPHEFEWQFWPKARPGIHMPRWASRITLKVTDVRVQRLQDISDRDALCEGVEGVVAPVAGRDVCIDGEYWPGGPSRMFRTLWNSINEKRGFGWQSNPWVVAVSFDVHRCNVDLFKDEVAA